MAFVKLDVGILDSSVWMDREAREVFVAAMAMARPFEASEEMPVLHPEKLEELGWSVPAGRYGIVEAVADGIVKRAMPLKSRGPGLSYEHAIAALHDLCGPDPKSKNTAFDGRRMVRVEGGFLILNFEHYRGKDHGNAERCKAWRKRKTSDTPSDMSPKAATRSRHGDRHVATCRDMQAEAEAEAEAEASLPTGEREQLALADVVPEPPKPRAPSRPKGGKNTPKAPACSDDEWSSVMEGYRVARETAGLDERWGVYKDNDANRAKVARIYRDHSDADVAIVFLHIGRKIRDGTFGDVKWAGLEYVMRAMDKYLNEAAAADYQPKEPKEQNRQRPGGAFVPRGEYKNL